MSELLFRLQLSPKELPVASPVEDDANALNPSRNRMENAVFDIGWRPFRMEIHSEIAAHKPSPNLLL